MFFYARRLAALLPLCALEACLPSRDNPRDPTVRPTASLRVVDSGSAASCGSTTGGNEAALAPRGHCLALDASASSDPRNSTLTYVFALPAAGTFLAEAREQSAPRLVLDSAYRAALPIGEAISFSLTTKNTRGAASITVTKIVVLTNTAPVAVAPPHRVLPANGFPWAPSSTYDLSFDGSASVDPDGDSLSWCWSFDGAAEECHPEATITRTISSSRGRVAARLRVRDNDAAEGDPRTRFSPPVFTDVIVGDSPLWFAPNDRRASRLDGTLPLKTADALPAAASFLAAPISRVALAWQDPANGFAPSLSVLDWPDGRFLPGTVLLDPTFRPLRVETDASRVWIELIDNASAVLHVASFVATSSGTLTSVMPAVDIATDPFSVREPLTAAIDAAGTLWTAPDADGFWIVDRLGVATHHGAGSGTIYGFGRRPGTTDVWATRVRPGSELSEIIVFPGGNPNAPTILADAHHFIRDFAFAGRDRLWLALGGEGLGLADPGVLAAGLPLEQALLFNDATIQYPHGLVVDEIGGRSYGSTASGGFAADETGKAIATDGVVVPMFADPSGTVWFGGFSGSPPQFRLHARSTPSVGRTAAVSYVAVRGTGSTDLRTGELWLALVVPGALGRIGTDGTLLRYEPEIVDDASGVIPFPQMTDVQIAPGSAIAWARTSAPSRIMKIDLDAEPPSARTIIGTAGTLAFFDMQGALIPSTPIGSGARFLWAARGALNAAVEIIEIDESGNDLAAAVPLPAASLTGLKMSRSLRTNRLCVASTDVSGSFDVRWISPNGASEILTTVPLDPQAALVAVAVSDDGAGGDLCWVADRRADGSPGNWNVRAYRDAASGAVRSFSEFTPAVLFSIAPEGPDFLWVSDVDQNATAPRLRGLAWDASVPGWTEERTEETLALFAFRPE